MIESNWMRFKASLIEEDGEEPIVKLDYQDYSDASGFQFYKDEIDDVIKTLEFLKERISE
jgi:hypothetical protein